jgi:hypothetical protein
MSTSMRIAAIALALSGLQAAPATAQVQALRTWVAATGDDARPCTEALPCKTFQRAINRTIDGGEVNCLDSGGYGPMLITKSISLICDQSEAGVIALTDGMVISAPPNSVVVISGVDFDGLGQTPIAAENGINFISGGVLRVRHARFRGFRGGYGIYFAPANDAELVLDDVEISDSGCGCTHATGGIGIAPTGGGTVQAMLSGVQAIDNVFAGLRIDTSAATGGNVVATVTGSRFAHNNAGIVVKAPAGTAAVRLTLTDSIVAQNLNYGITANGPTVSGRVGNTTVTANGTGLVVGGGASLRSYGTNRIDDNTTDGAFTLPLLAPK